MNKVLHYYLMPRGSEKNPNIEKLALLHAFMTRMEIDVAYLIFEEMHEFFWATKSKANLPFGSLVTVLCE